jgi:AraC family L-rhamnose operon regulatory protein RhaS
MPRPVPIFKDEDGIWQADACLPLVHAVATQHVLLEALARGHYPGRRLPQTAVPGVKSVGYWHIEHEQNWGLPWHRNEGIELTFLESGGLGFAAGAEEHTLRPGDLTITRPWQRHRVGNPFVAPGRLHWLILDVGVRRPHQVWKWPSWLLLSAADLEGLTRILRHNERVVWKTSAAVRRCFQTLGETVKNSSEETSLSWLAVKINELLLLLLQMMRQQNVSLDDSLSSSLRTVQLFLDDLRASRDQLAQDWTVHAMAASCGLGVTQFDHHVKILTNSTPLRYLNESRLSYAMLLLEQEPDLTVTQVALECGFSSGQYFATAFRRRYGQSPRAVANLVLAGNSSRRTAV